MLRRFFSHHFTKLRFRTLMQRALLSAGLVLGFIVIVIMLASAVTLTSETVRLRLAHALINQLNTSSDLHIAIDGLSTPGIEQWQMEKLVIERDHRVWIDIRHAALHWQPSALFGQALIIESLSANNVVYYPLQEENKTDSQPDSASSKRSLPVASIQLQKLVIDTLSLEDITDERGKKESLSYTIDGAAKWHKNTPLLLNFSALTLTKIPARLTIQSRSEDWNSVVIEGSLLEDAGGFFGELLQLPKEQKIAASFNTLITLNRQHFNVDIESFNFPLAGRKVDLTSQFVLTKNTFDLHLNRLDLVIDKTKHTLTGSWIGGELNIDLNLDQFPLGMVSPWITLLHSGALTTQVNIQGPVTRPTVRGQIAANAIYDNKPVSIDFMGSANRDEILFKRLNASWDTTRITALGHLDITGETSKLSLSAKHLNIDTLRRFNIKFPSELQATITSAQAKMYGSIQDPQGKLTFSANGRYKQLPFVFSADLSKVLDTVTIKNTSLTAMKGNAQVDGEFRIDSLAGNLNINANAIPLNLLELAGISLPDTLGATVDSHLSIKGLLTKPAIEGSASIHGQYQDILFNADVIGHYRNNNVQVEKLTLYAFDEKVFTASGSYQAQQFNIRMQAQQLPSTLFSATGWRPQPGQFNANIEARGTLEKPLIDGTISYETVLPGFDDHGEEKPITYSWELNASTVDNVLNLASTFKRDNNTPAELLLKIPTGFYARNLLHNNTSAGYDTLPLQGAIKGAFDLRTLSFLLDPDLHHLDGVVNADFTLGGILKKPIIDGFLNIEKANYENTVTGTTVNSINCSITTQQTIFHIDTCQATDGSDGSYIVDGEVQLPSSGDSGKIVLGLNASNANILRQPNIEGEATGRITLTGNFKELLAAGKLELSPFTAILNSDLISENPSIVVEEIYAEQTVNEQTLAQNSELPPIILPSITLNVLITASRQAYLRGHGLDAELQGEILIKGNLQQPHYEGAFETVRGVFNVFGKKFKLEQGQVTFANNAISLSIPGVYQKKGQQIRAEIVGTNNNITLSLSATPTMQEDEILAFIIFGKSLQNITPFEAIQFAGAVQSLRSAGGGFFDPIGKTRDLLGIDSLSVEAETTDAGENGVNVGIGKYLNEKVYLEVERTPNPSQPWKGNLEIELTPNVSLESSTGGKSGIDGAEIKWKRDY